MPGGKSLYFIKNFFKPTHGPLSFYLFPFSLFCLAFVVKNSWPGTRIRFRFQSGLRLRSRLLPHWLVPRNYFWNSKLCVCVVIFTRLFEIIKNNFLGVNYRHLWNLWIFKLPRCQLQPLRMTAFPAWLCFKYFVLFCGFYFELVLCVCFFFFYR